MQLLGLRVENVGGFQTAELDTRSTRLLVGENNSGKTSLLRILDWIFNTVDEDLLTGQRRLSEAEQRLLVPARATRNKARRIFVRIAIPDGRTARKYGAVEGIAELRIQFRAGSTYAKITPPQRGEQAESELKGLQLLSALQDHHCVLYIAAARDARSQVFSDSLKRALSSQFEFALLPQGQGVSAGARKVRTSTDTLRKAGEREATAVWKAAQEHLRGVFSPDALFEIRLDPERILEYMIEQVEPTFSLGSHDVNRVPVELLGAGTQSILAMALTQLSMADAPKKLLLLEEPEAFLHPSAQRTLAWQILQPGDIQVVATTHSPLVLAEARPADVVVLRSHTVYPAGTVDALQEAKDQYQLSTWVSGAMFDRSLLLVEGPGDLAFFEGLRRKLVGIVPVSVLSRLRVAAVGGKASFGPWLRLLRRYRDPNSGATAFNALLCADSADAVTDVLRALRESTISVGADLQSNIKAITSGFATDNLHPADAASVAARTRAVNQLAAESGLLIHFTPVDLEYAATAGLTDARARAFAALMGLQAATSNTLAAKLGSKGGDGAPSEAAGAKAPYMRAALADFLDWSEVSRDVKDLLWRWIRPGFDGDVPSRPKELT
jgi:ABC-type transport system involved in cytochrome c biogenesis ATPase subunit